MNDFEILFNRYKTPEELADMLIQTPESERAVNVRRSCGDFFGLSIKPIWAWLIVSGYKDIENRNWSTKFRGRFVVCATSTMTRREYEEAYKFAASIDVDIANAIPPYADIMKLARHALGSVELADVCPPPTAQNPTITSPWHFDGNFGFKLARPIAYKTPFQVRGQLGFFRLPAELNQILKSFEDGTGN